VKCLGNKACVFCSNDETIKYLFFGYNFARSIWSITQETLGFYPPTGVTKKFGNWLNVLDYKYKILLRVGAIALFGRFVYVEMIKCLTIIFFSLAGYL
jgi:hypothetical protein